MRDNDIVRISMNFLCQYSWKSVYLQKDLVVNILCNIDFHIHVENILCSCSFIQNNKLITQRYHKARISSMKRLCRISTL